MRGRARHQLLRFPPNKLPNLEQLTCNCDGICQTSIALCLHQEIKSIFQLFCSKSLTQQRGVFEARLPLAKPSLWQPPTREADLHGIFCMPFWPNVSINFQKTTKDPQVKGSRSQQRSVTDHLPLSDCTAPKQSTTSVLGALVALRERSCRILITS